MTPSTLRDAASAISSITSTTSTPTSGHIIRTHRSPTHPTPTPAPVHVRLAYSQRDPRAAKVRASVRDVVWLRHGAASASAAAADDDVLSSAFPHERNGAVESVSPTRALAVRFVADGGPGEGGGSGADDSAKRWVEVWVRDRMVACVGATGVHLGVYDDEMFGGVAWAPGEGKVVYVAERKAPESRGLWEHAPRPGRTAVDHGPQGGQDDKLLGEKHTLREDFGETFVAKRQPALFCLDLVTHDITELAPEIPAELAVGDPQWSPDGDTVVFTGRTLGEPPLGLRHCWNRPCGVYSFSLRSRELSNLTKEFAETTDFSSRSPRYHPSGESIVFLSAPRTEENAHMVTQRLRRYDFTSGKVSTVVDIVDQADIGDLTTDFPGIYHFFNLPRTPFLDDARILFETQWGFTTVPVIGYLDGSKPPSRVFGDADCARDSYTILDLHHGFLLCARSNLHSSGQVVISDLAASPDRACTVLAPPTASFSDDIEVFGPVDLVLDDGDHPLVLEDFADPEQRRKRFQAVLLCPANAKPGSSPLLCFPHGGPHAAHSTAFSTGLCSLVLSGFSVVLVNYRGSTGLGHESLLSLPGRVGDQDVKECVAATRWALTKPACAGVDRVGVIGGSHGGFLGAHLTAQYPDMFRAAVLRNPVVNIATMSGGTDIADWCFAESGLGDALAVTDKALQAMFQRSPMAHAHRATAATLLQIGSADRRVPPQQGIEWLRALRRNGARVRVMWYEGSEHSLADAVSGDDAWAQALAWLWTHLMGRRG